jgi:hypothetical protein
MYDTTTWGRVVPDNKAWNEMTKDQVWDNMCRIWDKPQNYAVSHIKAGIAHLERLSILTSEEATANLKETLKARRKAKRTED